MASSIEKMFMHHVSGESVHFTHKLANLTVTKDWWEQEGRPFEITVNVEVTV